MSKLIAIVGRPNVGKSTLFNRLTQTRRAIVDDTAGTTRDRQYGKVDWNGQEFSIVDTGGWVVNSDDVFEEEINKQVEIAIEEADVILFVVDATTGVTDLDDKVASILRRSKKPVIVVANKEDVGDARFNEVEFYSLGLGDPIGISSANGSGTGELLDEVVKDMPQKDDDSAPEDDVAKFAIVGRPNAGKSSLINAFIGEERHIVTDIAGTTRDSIYHRYNKFGFDFYLVDTAGIRTTDDQLERMGIERTLASIARARIVIHLIDATTIKEAIPAPDFPLREDQTLLTVINKTDAAPALVLPDGVIGISALSGSGVDLLCRALRSAVDTEGLFHGDTVVSNSRHFQALSEASAALDRALLGLQSALPSDLLAEEIRSVIRALSSITGIGAIIPDNILSNIFSKFCIGK